MPIESKKNRIASLVAALATPLVYYALTTALILTGNAILKTFFPITPQNAQKYMFGMEIVLSVILLLVVFVAHQFISRKSAKDVPLSRKSSKRKAASGLLIPASVLSGLAISGFAYLWVTVLNHQPDSAVALSKAAGEFLISVLFAPVIEELLFRGVIFRLLQKFRPGWFAILLSSAIFGAYHLDLIQGIMTFFMGIVLAYMYDRSKNIAYPIFIHAINNFLVVLLAVNPIHKFAFPVHIATIAAIIPMLYVTFYLIPKKQKSA